MRIRGAFVALVVAIAGCGGASSEPTASSSTTATPLPTSTLAPTTSEATTTTSPPTTTTTLPRNASLAIAGDEEVVFDWTTDRCADDDIPDLPARAFRDADGTVNMISTSIQNRRFTGPSLDQLDHPCSVILASARNADPAVFADAEWIASVYTEDGETVYALVHDEYHGWEHGDCAGVDNFLCWYNAVTLAVSTDGGETYRRVPEPPGHFVAGLPYRYEQSAVGAEGIFSPSNIVKGPGDQYYALAKVGLAGRQTVCLMRTPDLADPTAWRFWDGEAFAGVFIDPYASPPDEPDEAHLCPPLAIDAIGAQMIESLTWNTYLERWVLVGISADTIDGREVWGFFYSFSDDLIDWTRRRLLLEIELPWTVEFPGSDVSYLYPSLLDPDSPSVNFETTGDTAYLYFTRNNHGHASLDRDLIRVPVVFSFDD